MSKKAGGGNKKQGRNTAKCARYRASGKLERRKTRNMMRHNGYPTLEAATIAWRRVKRTP